jgi:hypothetical protein
LFVCFVRLRVIREFRVRSAGAKGRRPRSARRRQYAQGVNNAGEQDLIKSNDVYQ